MAEEEKNASYKTIPKLMLATILGNTDILRYFWARGPGRLCPLPYYEFMC